MQERIEQFQDLGGPFFMRASLARVWDNSVEQSLRN
jgi:hypothetical protein